MPKDLIYSAAIICERCLVETDQVISAIRIVDVFFKDEPPTTELPPEVEQNRVALIALLLIAKFEPGGNTDHTFRVSLKRPSGEVVALDDERAIKIDFSKNPNGPAGFNLILHIPVKMREMGTHYFVAEVDGEEISRVPFTLAERALPAAGVGSISLLQ